LTVWVVKPSGEEYGREKPHIEIVQRKISARTENAFVGQVHARCAPSDPSDFSAQVILHPTLQEEDDIDNPPDQISPEGKEF
jgi:hypothetical protein